MVRQSIFLENSVETNVATRLGFYKVFFNSNVTNTGGTRLTLQRSKGNISENFMGAGSISSEPNIAIDSSLGGAWTFRPFNGHTPMGPHVILRFVIGVTCANYNWFNMADCTECLVALLVKFCMRLAS
jgi:hypothetical protein